MTIALELTPHPAPTESDPRAHVQRVVTQSRSSFATAMQILPRERREAIYAVYAFCRTVDDIADGPGTSQVKRAALDEWRHEVDLLYQGAPKSLIGRALVDPIERYALPREEFIYMIEGMEMDADGPVVAPTYETLLAYTRRVAGSVGMLSMRIFGAWRGDVSETFALSLADALQLTNILRDVEEDAEIGRLYLPGDLLVECGIETTDPSVVAGHQRLPDVCRTLGDLAWSKFAEARAAIPAHSRLRLIPALMMMGVYERYLLELDQRAWRRGSRLSFSKRKKAAISLRYAFLPLPRRAGP